MYLMPNMLSVLHLLFALLCSCRAEILSVGRFSLDTVDLTFRVNSPSGKVSQGAIDAGLGHHQSDANVQIGRNELSLSWARGGRVTVSERDVNCFDVDTVGPVQDGQLVYDIELGSANWYGGGEQRTQPLCIQTIPRPEAPFVPADMLGSPQLYGPVAEPYFLSSDGVSYRVSYTTPLFVTLNETHLSFKARKEPPFRVAESEALVISVQVCTGHDILETHLESNLRKPTGIPLDRMMAYPIWSTWAKYFTNINENVVLDYANQIVANNYPNSQVEIDDKWESCYGSEEFDSTKFPDPKAMVDGLKALNFTVTLWVHPFSNDDCFRYDEGVQLGYFVRNQDNQTGQVNWWQGRGAAVVDTTNPDAVAWWTARLEKLRTQVGIDSFKFDAGEYSYIPSDYALNGPLNLQPSIYTSRYAETAATFGGQIEVRVGYNTQELPVFVRMLDKDSKWGLDNGLRAVITSTLHFGIVGYPFVLADMIGGNAYQGTPSKELFIRWTQANVFMPSMQFSIPPWDYDQETNDAVRQLVQMHVNHLDLFVELAQQAVVDGSPINRPLWWIAPNDTVAQAVDDQFLLGNDILVAPVLDEGAVSRDIYLPQGTWHDVINDQMVMGPTWLTNYSATLFQLPHFHRESSYYSGRTSHV